MKMDPYKIVKYPLSTEKSIRLMESQNKLVFIVDIDADKKIVRSAIEKMFKVKVENVKVHVTKKEEKSLY